MLQSVPTFCPVPPSSICTNRLAILTFEFWPSKQEGLRLKKQQILPSAFSAFLSLNLCHSPRKHDTISPVKQDQFSKQARLLAQGERRVFR